jgi:hypothetical protein
MRGGKAVEMSGGLQIQSLMVANLTVAVWLAWVILTQLQLF